MTAQRQVEGAAWVCIKEESQGECRGALGVRTFQTIALPWRTNQPHGCLPPPLAPPTPPHLQSLTFVVAIIPFVICSQAIKFDLALAEGQLEYLLQTHEDQRDELGGGDGGSSDGGGDDPAAAASQSKQAAVEPEPEPEPAGPVQQGGNGGGGSGGGGKKSKAQKRREKKEREEKERAVRIAKVDPKKGESMKEVEYAQIKEILTPLKGIIMYVDGLVSFCHAVSTVVVFLFPSSQLNTST